MTISWRLGTAEPIQSSGGDVTVFWRLGAAFVSHEYEQESFPAVSSIVSPSSANVAVQGTQQFTVVYYDEFDNPTSLHDVTVWSVSGGGSIDSGTGLFTADTVAGGTYTVTATAGSVSDTSTVTITGGVLASIVVSPATANITKSTTRQFTAVGYDEFSNVVSIPSLVWSVDDGGNINESTGLFTAGEVTGGPFTVTATSGIITDTSTINIVEPSIGRSSNQRLSLSIGIGF